MSTNRRGRAKAPPAPATRRRERRAAGPASPFSPLSTTRATASKRMRSALGILSPRRRYAPPGRCFQVLHGSIVEERCQRGVYLVEVAHGMFVEDHDVRAQSFEAPVLLGLKHLPHQRGDRSPRPPAPEGWGDRPTCCAARVLPGRARPAPAAPGARVETHRRRGGERRVARRESLPRSRCPNGASRFARGRTRARRSEPWRLAPGTSGQGRRGLP